MSTLEGEDYDQGHVRVLLPRKSSVVESGVPSLFDEALIPMFCCTEADLTEFLSLEFGFLSAMELSSLDKHSLAVYG